MKSKVVFGNSKLKDTFDKLKKSKTEDKKLYVDAKVFAGYEDRIIAGYTDIGSRSEFTIEFSIYLRTFLNLFLFDKYLLLYQRI